MRLWGFGRLGWVETQPRGTARKVGRFNFAELRGCRFLGCWFFFCFFFASCRCTCLLFMLRSENGESGRWPGATCSPLWGCSCLLPSTPWKALLSCAEIYRPSPPLDAVWPPRFFFLLPCPPPRLAGNRLIFRPGPQIFIPSRLTENLRGSVRASTKRSSRAKSVCVGTGHVPCCCTHAQV